MKWRPYKYTRTLPTNNKCLLGVVETGFHVRDCWRSSCESSAHFRINEPVDFTQQFRNRIVGSIMMRRAPYEEIGVVDNRCWLSATAGSDSPYYGIIRTTLLSRYIRLLRDLEHTQFTLHYKRSTMIMAATAHIFIGCETALLRRRLYKIRHDNPAGQTAKDRNRRTIEI